MAQPKLTGKYVAYGKEVLFVPDDETKSRGAVCQAAREDVADKIVKALNAHKDGLIVSLADYNELKCLREWHRKLDVPKVDEATIKRCFELASLGPEPD